MKAHPTQVSHMHTYTQSLLGEEGCFAKRRDCWFPSYVIWKRKQCSIYVNLFLLSNCIWMQCEIVLILSYYLKHCVDDFGSIYSWRLWNRTTMACTSLLLVQERFWKIVGYCSETLNLTKWPNYLPTVNRYNMYVVWRRNSVLCSNFLVILPIIL